MGYIIKTKLKRRGNSLGFIIPREIIDAEGLKEGDEIDYMIIKDGQKRIDELFDILKEKFR